MSKKDKKTKRTLPPALLKASEYVVPTIISFAIISSFLLVYVTIDKAGKDNTAQTEVNLTPTKVDTSNSKVEISIQKEGTGEGAKTGDNILVNYTGMLTDGTKFDSSLNPGREPFPLTLGQGRVIQGWEQGLLGMKVGEKRKLTIPPELGYGSAGQGPIPPNSTLIFEVELLKIN